MIGLPLIKAHLRIEHSHDDQLLEAYKNAALSTFEVMQNRKLVDVLPAPEELKNEIVMQDSIAHGALMLIGSWYENRESVIVGVSVSAVPMATEALWNPHRWYNV